MITTKSIILPRLFLIATLLLSHSMYCQLCQNLQFKVGSDTTNIAFKRQTERFYSLKDIECNKNDYSFRLSFYGSVITIYKYNELYFGDIQKYTDEVDCRGETGKFFKITFSIPSEKVKKTIALIENTSIKTIPSQKYISEWQHGLDGITYLIEEKDSIYSIKSYWTPLVQSAPEAKKIGDFVDELLDILDFPTFDETFYSQVPFASYSLDSVTVSKVMTNKEYRIWKRGCR